MARRDDDEFAAFAAASAASLHRTAYLICGDWDRAADVTQEALIRMYVAWPRLDRERSLLGYARRTVVRIAIDQARKRSSREVPTLDLVDATTDDVTSQVADRVLLMAALADLPPRQRACVVLRYYEDLSVDAVAQTLGCRAGTVKSQTARGLDALRAAYSRHGGELGLPDARHETADASTAEEVHP